MLSGEAANTNFIIFGLTHSGLESTIYRTRGEHANHYITNAVIFSSTKAAMNIINFKNQCFLFYLNIQNIHIKQYKKLIDR